MGDTYTSQQTRELSAKYPLDAILGDTLERWKGKVDTKFFAGSPAQNVDTEFRFKELVRESAKNDEWVGIRVGNAKWGEDITRVMKNTPNRLHGYVFGVSNSIKAGLTDIIIEQGSTYMVPLEGFPKFVRQRLADPANLQYFGK